jgi:DNA polymerase I-like protein with 3'-5' exonuclease and polymerase domains
VQQISKHPKADGETPKVREVIVPHKKNAVVVSFDFAAQELRVIADYSKTPMLAYDHRNKEYVRRCVDVLRKADVIALPDGRLQLNPASNLDVSKGN